MYSYANPTDYIWKAILAEFVGTFVLLFVGASAVALTAAQGGSVLGSALAFGFVLIAIFYMLGWFSGAHVNPAVSFGFWVAGRMNAGLMIGYWIAQLLGGIAAAALVAYLFGTSSGVGASVGSLTNTDAWKAVLLEAILTLILVFTVLLVTGNPTLAVISGVAIGVVFAALMLAGSALTGASMNPARSFGPALFSNNLGTIWIYIVGPLVGALIAALIYRLMVTDFSCCVKKDECGEVCKDECGRPIKICKRPVVDRCGKQISDCDGAKWEEYEKREVQLNHMQQTPLSAVNQYLSAHGYSPLYMKEKADHLKAKADKFYHKLEEKAKEAAHRLEEHIEQENLDAYIDKIDDVADYVMEKMTTKKGAFTPLPAAALPSAPNMTYQSSTLTTTSIQPQKNNMMESMNRKSPLAALSPLPSPQTVNSAPMPSMTL